MRAARRAWRLLVLASVLSLGACADMAAPHTSSLPAMATQWQEQSDEQPAAEPSAGPPAGDWWAALHDAVLERLLATARFGSVEQAMASLAEARAQLGTQQAQGQPQLQALAAAQRGLEQNGVPQLVSRAGPSLQLGWEIDLWGRQAQAQAAAQQRVQQRQAELALARLLAQTELATLLERERHCRAAAELQRADAEGWQRSAAMDQQRLQLGAIAEQQWQRARAAAADALALWRQTQAQCRVWRQGLRALSGLDGPDLHALLDADTAARAAAPTLPLALPATLLLQHPQLRAAMAAADAAQHELASSRAARLPSLSLAGLLSHQWLRVLGQGSEQQPWSLGAQLKLPLLDGGADQARVAGAQARLQRANATLEQTLRQTVREVESALAQQAAAGQRLALMQERDAAAARSWAASEGAARAGRLSALALEEAARQRRAASQALLAAQRDQRLAWTDLVKAAAQPLANTTP
ncbi:TolC family protein [Paucibacter soli]|uniref:TolC family protein n=1 Tax=Paucibacter soli TaxID=3133433 RepID=UPI0030ABF750